jgi:hypothetical protein
MAGVKNRLSSLESYTDSLSNLGRDARDRISELEGKVSCLEKRLVNAAALERAEKKYGIGVDLGAGKDHTAVVNASVCGECGKVIIESIKVNEYFAEREMSAFERAEKKYKVGDQQKSVVDDAVVAFKVKICKDCGKLDTESITFHEYFKKL